MNYQQPDTRGYFGNYGGRFVPETIMSALEELENAFKRLWSEPEFQEEYRQLLHDFAGRPTPLYRCGRLVNAQNGAQLFLKREDLAHTGAHKINNTIGQVLLASKMGKRRVICETGAGQHGVATATVCARFGLECVVYMGAEDCRRQQPNLRRIQLLGASVMSVQSGARTLKDATNEALRDWVTNVASTYYCIGSAVGPHPYPLIVREFQKIIGEETRAQILQKAGRLPDLLIACVGGGSNALGLFYPFLDDPVRLIGVEAAGLGLDSHYHAATLNCGRPGVLHGMLSYLLQNADGQILPTHSVSAGLDYPGVGPEHAYLKDCGRIEYAAVTDEEAMQAFRRLSRTEGIIPALESAHALAQALKIMQTEPPPIIIVNLSGRGDKDLSLVEE